MFPGDVIDSLHVVHDAGVGVELDQVGYHLYQAIVKQIFSEYTSLPRFLLLIQLYSRENAKVLYFSAIFSIFRNNFLRT